MNMQAINLALSLALAIKASEALGAGSTALVQGWRDVLAALQRGEEVRIVGVIE